MKWWVFTLFYWCCDRDVHNWNIALNICLNGSRTAWLSQQNDTAPAKYYIYGWRDRDTTHLCTCPVCCHSCCDQDDMHRCNFPVCLCSCPPTLSRRCLGLCHTRLCLKETERRRERGERDYDSLSSLYVSWCCVLYGFGETETEIVSHDMSSFYIP